MWLDGRSAATSVSLCARKDRKQEYIQDFFKEPATELGLYHTHINKSGQFQGSRRDAHDVTRE